MDQPGLCSAVEDPRIEQRRVSELPEIRSLGDARRIQSLEAANADLERRLAQANAVVRPTMETPLPDCRHFGTPQVSQNLPEVTCGDCGKAMDPYVILRAIAHREMNFCHSINDLRKEQRDLLAEVKKLKAARARLRKGSAVDP